MGFPKDFVWGAASSAYQVEGAQKEGGKGDSVWNMFARIPGAIADGSNGDLGCDHYHHLEEDVALMAQMGLKAYRFSIDWSRVLPEGTGRVNEEGVDFYVRLVDLLLEHGIEPYVTLYHWELPLALHRRGGWLNPEIADWFGDYAALISERLSSRVKYFFTVNEPQCFIGLGYVSGEHAPGLRVSLEDGLQAAHNVLRAHGRAVQQLRLHAKQPLTIGYAPTCGVIYPETERPEDIEAAKSLYFGIPEDTSRWFWNVSWWSDPVFFGAYPEEGLRRFHGFLPRITKEDMRLISEPIDMYGQNIYNGMAVRAGEDGKPLFVPRYPGFPTTDTGWPVTPEALRWGPRFLYERYGKPIYITENGAACADAVSADGRIHDQARIDFLAAYLAQLKKACSEADVRGYFQWSVMDNFEWAQGFAKRFGLAYVDYRDGRRILKDSAFWYRDLIQSGGESL